MNLQKLPDTLNLGDIAVSPVTQTQLQKMYDAHDPYAIHLVGEDVYMYPTRHDELCYSDLLLIFNEAMKEAEVASISFNDIEKEDSEDGAPIFGGISNGDTHKVREVSLVLELPNTSEATLSLIKFISESALPLNVLNEIMARAIKENETNIILPNKVVLDPQVGFGFAEDPRVNYKEYISGKKPLLVGLNYGFELASKEELEAENMLPDVD